MFSERKINVQSRPKMKVNRAQNEAINITTSTEPLLYWGNDEISKVSPARKNHPRGANICFKDESSTDGKITLIIEPPTSGSLFTFAKFIRAPILPYWQPIHKIEAHGYFFEKNKETGKIDMIHRSKPVNGRDEKKMYNDCTYFGAVVEKRKCANGNIIDKSVFVVTSGHSDRHFPTGINFASSPSYYQDLTSIVAAINALIYSAHRDREILSPSKVYRLYCTNYEFECQCLLHHHEIGLSKVRRRKHPSYQDDCIPPPVYVDSAKFLITYPDGSSSESLVGNVITALAVCVSLPLVVTATV